jgi:hypothetical protein
VYLAEGAEPGSDLKAAGGGAEAVLSVDYKVAGKPNGKLELVRIDEGGVAHYYVRTETTRNWVAVYDSMAKDVEQDVGMVLGIETAPSKAVADTVPATDAHGRSVTPPPGHPGAPGPVSPHGAPGAMSPHGAPGAVSPHGAPPPRGAVSPHGSPSPH